MATTIKIPNHALYLMATQAVDWDNDSFYLILCSNFVFDIDTDIEYANVSANELSTAYGYTIGGILMTGGVVVEDDTNNDARRSFDDVTVAASGGDIGPYQVAIIYNDTLANDPIMASFTYSAGITIGNGDSSVFENLIMRLKSADSLT